VYCDRCGEQADIGDHAACRTARELEPPRYCVQCRRRMQVQVTPRDWVARCSVHGPITAQAGR
jgi:hypothetical protein